MDSHKLLGKVKGGKFVSVIFKVMGVAALVAGGFYFGDHVFKAVKTAASHGVAAEAQTVVRNIQYKVDELARADEENQRLRLENANMRLQAESMLFECRLREGGNKVREVELKLSKETGARVGRSLASIYYRPPTHLPPPQLYTLAVSYFKGLENEKAAVIFTFLTGLEDNDEFKTAKNFLMTGVAWYRLENFELADAYFERSLQVKETTENNQYLAQAKLWRALVSDRTGQPGVAQYWMRELVDYHPNSEEAGWVNAGGERSDE